ncbi:MAG: hypothetical protein Q9211_003962 [Gyalolechia sp. 1 TL-2023]
MEQLQASAIASLKSIASQNSRKQRDRLKVLKDLLIRRAAIQTEILRGTAKLERAFSNANQELQTVLTSRIKALNNKGTGGGTVAT